MVSHKLSSWVVIIACSGGLNNFKFFLIPPEKTIVLFIFEKYFADLIHDNMENIDVKEIGSRLLNQIKNYKKLNVKK